MARWEITDVHFGYEPGIEVIRGLDVSVQPGEQVALVGETGARQDHHCQSDHALL